MTDETLSPPPEDEISLRDLLLVIAENARLSSTGRSSPLWPRWAALGGRPDSTT